VKYRLNRKAVRDFELLSPALQQRVKKQLDFLCQNLRHPSLQAKKYNEAEDLRQARVARNHRFYFQIRGDSYVILRIIPHPK
jgi:mRNA-degrading endonuclease RelE of RelBE toxin-antitoxin system